MTTTKWKIPLTHIFLCFGWCSSNDRGGDTKIYTIKLAYCRFCQASLEKLPTLISVCWNQSDEKQKREKEMFFKKWIFDVNIIKWVCQLKFSTEWICWLWQSFTQSKNDGYAERHHAECCEVNCDPFLIINLVVRALCFFDVFVHVA